MYYILPIEIPQPALAFAHGLAWWVGGWICVVGIGVIFEEKSRKRHKKPGSHRR